MSEIDPEEYLLRNFSKHKFKTYIEKTILTLESYGDEFVPENGGLFKADWPEHDLAYMDMPAQMGIRSGVTAYNRWIFHVDHLEDGLIRPEKILERARLRIARLCRSLAGNDDYLKELREKLYDSIGHRLSDGAAYHEPVYGTAIIYYLTNADIDPYNDERSYKKFQDAVNSDVRSVFLEKARNHGLELEKAQFGAGVGSPKIFLQESRDKALTFIREIENRPDSVNLQIEDGRVRVTCSNQRLVSVYDERNPKVILLDETINPNSYFSAGELEELLNRPTLSIAALSRFLAAQPHFLSDIDYDELKPQVTLGDEAGQVLRPDLFLRLTGDMPWDLLDIKRLPTVLVSGRLNRERLAQSVYDGVRQLLSTAGVFDHPRKRASICQNTGIDDLKPRLSLALGKKSNVDKERWQRLIEQERPFVNILGFDSILDRAKKLPSEQK